ncbi:MAG: inositol monophosphatase family protein [Conexivisphaerales archaeon]
MQISDYLSFVKDCLFAAHQAVLNIEKSQDAGLSLGKGAYGDTTYKVDRVAEDAVISVAKEYFENPNIISEEAGVKNGRGVYILLDPVDGSTNAKRGVGLFSTSVAVSESREFSGIVAAGVIDHSNSRMVWGDGSKVFEDWRLAQPSRISNLEDAVVSFDSKFFMLSEEKMSRVNRLMRMVRYPRVFSTAALETAYIASGRIDAYVCSGGKLRSFDCFPSLFLLKTAKCPFSLEGLEDMRLDTKQTFAYYAASNEILYRKVSEILS